MTASHPATMVNSLAVALAASAELVQNGGSYECISYTHQVKSETSAFPSPPSCHSPQTIVSNETSDLSEDEEEEEEEEDVERRMARSRERNREHARRTRLRKKAQLETLQSKVKGLQAESQVLQQSLEECSVASILVGLSSGGDNDCTNTIPSLLQSPQQPPKDIKVVLGGSKRKRFISDADTQTPSPQPLKININGRSAVIDGGRTHINWKTGVYSDENGTQHQLTQEQLESLRYVQSKFCELYLKPRYSLYSLFQSFPPFFSRERNRIHAKMTRDRKKNFIATIEKTINDLEQNNQRMKKVLNEVVQTHFKPTVAPVTPEARLSNIAPQDDVPHLLQVQQQMQPASKRICHGFALS
jgi:hypothetical protein